MRRIAYILMSVLTVSLMLATSPRAGAASAAKPVWENVSQYVTGPDDANEPLVVDVAVRNSVLYITASRSAQVKVFTIIGRPISQETIPGGVSRLRGLNRGIYIIKVGNLTRRITI